MDNSASKVIVILGVLLLLASTNFASALNVKIENSRIVVSPVSQEKIYREIIVKNMGNEIVNVNIEPSNEVKRYLDIADKQFELSPNGEKNVSVIIYPTNNERVEGNVSVKFESESDKSSSVLFSTVIINKAPSDGSNSEGNKFSLTEKMDSIKNFFSFKRTMIALQLAITASLIGVLTALILKKKKLNSKKADRSS